MQGKASAGFRPPPHLMPGSVAAKRADMLRKPTKLAPEALDESDAPLAEALRALRTEEARSQGIAPFMVFSNRVLLALVEAKPTDERSFVAVSGLGPAKWEKYGPQILAVIEAHR